jgi:SPP1 family predicted phage head-tail adaptor
VRAGDLRDQVVIEAATVALDAVGEPIETWAPVATVWAQVKPQKYTTGVEALAQALGREAVATTYTVTIYYREGLTELQRLIWNGRELDIKRVLDPDGKRTWLELMCEAVP